MTSQATEPTRDVRTAPENLHVVRRRHPGRWLATAIVALIALAFLRLLIITEGFRWDVVGEFLFHPAVLDGIATTLRLTVLCMAISIVLGTIIALMRLSVNPLLNAAANFYQWFFRGTPALVQLLFWFNLSSIFPEIALHIGDYTVFSFDTNDVITPFVATMLGLGLNSAAYHSEYVRAGILSIDEGQTEAASAYGLRRLKSMRYVVMPQALRVIIPPTGNEVIGMLKYTSLASVIGSAELTHAVTVIYNRNFLVIPLLIVASLWYLAMTTVLSIGQYFIEQRYARGTTRHQKVGVIRGVLRHMRKGFGHR